MLGKLFIPEVQMSWHHLKPGYPCVYDKRMDKSYTIEEVDSLTHSERSRYEHLRDEGGKYQADFLIHESRTRLLDSIRSHLEEYLSLIHI